MECLSQQNAVVHQQVGALEQQRRTHHQGHQRTHKAAVRFDPLFLFFFLRGTDADEGIYHEAQQQGDARYSAKPSLHRSVRHKKQGKQDKINDPPAKGLGLCIFGRPHQLSHCSDQSGITDDGAKGIARCNVRGSLQRCCGGYEDLRQRRSQADDGGTHHQLGNAQFS